MLTVEGLTKELGLKLAAGAAAAADGEIRWVHISELADPTPWLSGGELLLTTGISLDSPERQRELVRLLAESELAGLGFGTGFDHAKLPKALLAEAKSRDFPVFEVPYEMPFIAITEAAARSLVNEQYDVLSRGLAVNERLERLVLEGGGLEEIAREVASAVGGSSVVLGARGERLATGGALARRRGRRLHSRGGLQPRGRGGALRPLPREPQGQGAGASGLAAGRRRRGVAGGGSPLRAARRLRAPLRAAGGDRGRP